MIQKKDGLYGEAKFEMALKDNSWEAAADKHILLMNAILKASSDKQ